jgi:hypothetical protein
MSEESAPFPTMYFRWLEKESAYVHSVHYYECSDTIPVRTLQQLWTGPDGDEWRDVPIEAQQ